MQKSILITGCSSGIGLYCATLLKRRGYRVFAAARKVKDVESLKQQGFEALQLDLDSAVSIRNAASHVIAETEGQLFALFNNATYGQPGAVEDLSRKALRQQFETNLFGTVELTNLLLPHMRKYNQGRIIQNSSVLGLVAMPFRGAYNASKFALEGITDTLRMELADTQIKVCLIEPGPIESRFRQNALTALIDHVDIEHSHFKQQYQTTIAKMRQQHSPSRFALGPEAVYAKLLHALESKRPKVRYYVTTPTYVVAYLKRLLPYRWLDKILIKG